MRSAAAFDQVIASCAMKTLPKDRAAVPRNEEHHAGTMHGVAEDSCLAWWAAWPMCRAREVPGRRGIRALGVGWGVARPTDR